MVDTDTRTRRAAHLDESVLVGALALGGVALVGEAAVHLQQYASIVHGVRWVGPLFLANAVITLVAAAGLIFRRTRVFAAGAGVVISAGSLAALVVSYGRGLFGYFEAGFRTAIAFAVGFELAAVILLTAGLTVWAALAHAASDHHRVSPRVQVEELAHVGGRA